MKNELLLLIEKRTDVLIDETKSKPQETLEFKMNKQMQTFSFNPPINLMDQSKRLISVTNSEATNSVFNITDKNISLSITIPCQWDSKYAEKAFDAINKFLELKSQKSTELHVEQVTKKGLFLVNDYSLPSLGTFKNETLEELKNVKEQ